MSVAPSSRPKVLMVSPMPEWDLAPMREAYDLVDLPADGPDGLDTVADITALVTSGGRGADAALIAALPALKLIAVYGVGYDKVDLEAAARHNVAVTNTPDVLTADVADMALALALALARRVVDGDAFARSGAWATESMPLTASVSGRKVGIVGLGRIGEAIARRFAGFETEIGYWNRSPKPPSSWRAFPTPAALAAWADILVVAVAGGGDTVGLVDASTIAALGRDGLLVNISRGTTIDEAALIAALESGAIAGAGLDVFLNEPAIDPRFFRLGNVVLSPHQGSATVATRQAMGALVRANLAAHFAGEALPTAIVRRRK
ncbi:Glyoxylate reductase [uncultured Pleomorphomonas sp.]|uniref:Glyoxylate reductase n=1 Tax=uncultured Pleomorphomonas sp. TaxID=442121 RepID=A0A212LKP0_9HYPH|nr:2-hydroxyacid dehydrogenase [uncultured Pleomorphomonas sp.]SCM78112.1 Glyoxylate reductase [uncultured Pleomorphomonas sp.]